MGIAALVLGIVSLIIGWIPFCGAIALIPAIIGLILGIVDVVQKNKKGEPKGIGIAGIVLSAIAIAIIIYWIFILGAEVGSAVRNEIDNALSTYNTVSSY